MVVTGAVVIVVGLGFSVVVVLVDVVLVDVDADVDGIVVVGSAIGSLHALPASAVSPHA